MTNEVLSDDEKEIIKVLVNNENIGSREVWESLEEKIPFNKVGDIIQGLENKGYVEQKGKTIGAKYIVTPKVRKDPSLHTPNKDKRTKIDNFLSKKDYQNLIGAKTDKTPDDDDPIISVTVNNPLVYLKRMIKSILKNEGMKFKISIEIEPLTAIAIVAVIAGISLGLNTIEFLVKNTPIYPPIRELLTKPDQSIDTAMLGQIFKSNQTYYLITNSDRATKIIASDMSTLDQYLTKKDNNTQPLVIVSGKYNQETNVLEVEGIERVE